MTKSIILLISALLLCSCSTMMNQKKVDPEPYGGTKESFNYLGRVNDPISATFVLIDISLSMLGDTIMLYSDLKENNESESKKSSSLETNITTNDKFFTPSDEKP
jgi:uncharacterized protein YceK